MVKHLAAVAAVLVSVGISSGQTKTDRAKAGLHGNVHTVRETFIRYRDSKPESRDTVKYDPNGNEIERVVVSDFGELVGKQTQTFDKAGLLEETIFVDAKGGLLDRSGYSYLAGKLVEILRYDDKKILREKTTRMYDPEGKLIKEIYYDPNVAQTNTVFKNDPSGNAIELAFYLADGKKAYAPVGPCLGAHRVTYTYDGNKKPLTKAVFETDGTLKKSWNFTYDPHGNLSLYVIKSGPNITTVSYAYEYDEKGNWIKRTSVHKFDNQMLDLMLKATGKTMTPEERKESDEETTKYTPSPEITRREITYFETAKAKP